MNLTKISLSKSLKAYVDQQVASRGYCTSGEYIRDLVRQEKEREDWRELMKRQPVETPK